VPAIFGGVCGTFCAESSLLPDLDAVERDAAQWIRIPTCEKTFELLERVGRGRGRGRGRLVSTHLAFWLRAR
jgi:hypothetical protein